MQLYFALEFIC